MINTLTPKQKQIFDFIQQYLTDHQTTPTLKVIAQKFHRSIPTIHQYLESIKKNNLNPFIPQLSSTPFLGQVVCSFV